MKQAAGYLVCHCGSGRGSSKILETVIQPSRWKITIKLNCYVHHIQISGSLKVTKSDICIESQISEDVKHRSAM